ncbi:MAG: hypothetical protein V1725_04470 [archaeon]
MRIDFTKIISQPTLEKYLSKETKLKESQDLYDQSFTCINSYAKIHTFDIDYTRLQTDYTTAMTSALELLGNKAIQTADTAIWIYAPEQISINITAESAHGVYILGKNVKPIGAEKKPEYQHISEARITGVALYAKAEGADILPFLEFLKKEEFESKVTPTPAELANAIANLKR